MKAWVVEAHGGPEALLNKTIPSPKAKPGEVVLRVVAVGLNHLDLWVRKGVPGHRFPLPLIPGCDVVAEDDKNGKRFLLNPGLSCGQCPSCKSGFEPTCAQYGILGETQNGGLAEWVSAPQGQWVELNPGDDPIEMASLPIAYVTAWSMLTRKTRLQSGEWVLIHAGGSGVSIAAIQIAKFLGAKVITTVGSSHGAPNKAEKAKALGADHVILYEEKSFREEVKALVQKNGRRGVDVVLDHVGAATFLDSLRVLVPGGRLAFCGATSGSKVELDLKPLFFKNISIFGSTMGAKADLAEVVRLYRAGKIKAVIDSVHAFDEVPSAFDRLESRQVFGKVVIRV